MSDTTPQRSAREWADDMLNAMDSWTDEQADNFDDDFNELSNAEGYETWSRLAEEMSRRARLCAERHMVART